MENHELREQLAHITEVVERIEANKQPWYKWIWRGILSGIGSTVGVAIILSITLFVTQQLTGVPILGGLVSKIKPYLEQRSLQTTPINQTNTSSWKTGY